MGEPAGPDLLSPFDASWVSAPPADPDRGPPPGPENESGGGARAGEADLVRQAIRAGTRDENLLTNRVFAARHPGRAGRLLDRAEPGFRSLSREWITIRDGIVRPVLRDQAPVGSAAGTMPDGGPVVGGPLAVVSTPVPTDGPYATTGTRARYGLPGTVAALHWIGTEWQRLGPGADLVVGDMSLLGGGAFGRHKSHRIGLDVDVHLRRGTDRMNTLAADYASTFRPLVQTFVELVERNPVLGVRAIGVVDPQLRGRTVQQWAGHVRHLHIRFCRPDGPGPDPDPGAVGGPPLSYYSCAGDERELEDPGTGSDTDEAESPDELDEAELLGEGTDPVDPAWSGGELFLAPSGPPGRDETRTVDDPTASGEADIDDRAEADDLMSGDESWADLAEEDQAAPTPTGTVTFSIRTDFAVHGGAGLSFDWARGEAVRDAQLEVVGTAVPVTVSDASGRATVRTTGLADGDYIARITHRSADRRTTREAGPAIVDGTATRPSRVYRQLDVRIRVRNGGIDSAWVEPGVRHGGIGNRSAARPSPGQVPVDWKPVWMATPMKVGEQMRPTTDVEAVVVHHTGGPRIGPAINTFLNAAEPGNAHYVIDRDGHVVKTAEDGRRANHAGRSRWAGRTGVSSHSVGIELVHQSGPFPEPQMQSLLRLLDDLRRSYPSVDVRRIVGHSDVATSTSDPTLLSNRRAEDPGVEFDWPRLEAAGLGLVPRPLAALTGTLSLALRSLPAVVAGLRAGDRDPQGSRPAVLGGRPVPGFVGTPVREIQQDLETIGYSCRPANGHLGSFDLHTSRAVDRFQRHFFAGRRQALRAGRLGVADPLTLAWIKAVRGGFP